MFGILKNLSEKEENRGLSDSYLFRLKLLFQNNLYRYDLIFLLLLCIKYAIPYFVWGDFFVFSHDNLDGAVVINKVIGDFYRSGFDTSIFSIFLGGSTEWFYYASSFMPITLIYAAFSAKTAYIVTEVLVITIAYKSMLSLLLKLNSRTFAAVLLSNIFALSTSYTTFGIGLAAFPIILGMIIFNDKPDKKIVLGSLFIGINSSFALHGLFYPFAVWISAKICGVKLNINNAAIVISAFLTGSLIATSGVVYAQYFSAPSHRTLWEAMPKDFSSWSLLKTYLVEILTVGGAYHAFVTPAFYCVPFLIAGLISGVSVLKRLSAYLCALVVLLVTVKLLTPHFYDYLGPLKSIQFDRTAFFMGFFLLLYGAMFFIFPANKSSKIVISTSAITYLVFCINFQTGFTASFPRYFVNHVVNSTTKSERDHLKGVFREGDYWESFRLAKKVVLNADTTGRGLYATGFDSYYSVSDYQCIKNNAPTGRAISIGADPMKAVYNGIPSIDGYNSLYPAAYKLKFRKVIERQLPLSGKTEYFDNWGSRVYTFTNDPNKIDINFSAAKELGATFVISLFELSVDGLARIYPDCKLQKLYLYRIN